MLILWIRKLKKDKQANDASIETQPFRIHDEDMKRFRELHQELQTVVNKDIMTTDGSVLAPIHGVRLAKNSQN
ncbi:MAG TPA: hypothetical protein G4O16_08335 [Dehalococcoidia bacterium]|nr:hypothetical protein [Dehalococcoidia bacterium]